MRRPSIGVLVALALVALQVTGCSHARQSPTEPSGGLSPVVRAYIDELIGIMRAHSLNRLKIDWIVDLRANGGGNMWPMIAGVGPILGEGVAGYFVDPLGGESVWGYRFGVSWNDDELIQRVDAPYRLRRESPRVAVLVGSATASSGEAVVIAFMKRPDTRSFGTSATCGLSTANQQYKLSDGASLFLTEAVMADRTKLQYGGPIPPDEWVPDARDVEQHAVTWLLSEGR